jgi:ABC-type phosphate transport system substrate-binding protein
MPSVADFPTPPARPLGGPARRLRRLLLLAAALLVSSVLPGPGTGGGVGIPEAGAQGRSVTLSPPNARAGEFVTVRWSGFTPGSTVSVFQCDFRGQAPKWESCAEPTWVGGATGPDGRGEVRFQVWQFTLTSLGTNPALLCGAGNCSVAVTECDTDFSNGRFAVAPLRVDPGGTNPIGGNDGDDGEPAGAVVGTDPVPPAGPPVPVTAAAEAGRKIVAISGQGFGPALDPLARVLKAKGIELDPTVKNSPSALDFFLTGSADLALTSRPFSPEQLEAIEAAGGKPSDYVFIPVAASPIALVHNMDVRGVPIQRFRMSVDTAAKLWQGIIVGVENSDLRRDNEGCGITISGRTSDRSLLGYYRTDRSGANYGFSTWLVTAGPGADGRPLWPPAPLGSEPPPSPNEQFPAADESRGRSSNFELAEFVKDGSPPGAVPQVTNESGRLRIGAVDLSEVIALEARTNPKPPPPRKVIRLVQVRNRAGNWTLPTSDAVNATLSDSKIGPDNIVEVNAATTAPDAYPILHVYYAAVRRAPGGPLDAATAATVKEVLTYLLSDEGRALLSAQGLVPVTGRLRERATTAVSALSTSSPTTTTTAPSGGGGDAPDAGVDAFVSDLGSDFSDPSFGDEEPFGESALDGGFEDSFGDGGGAEVDESAAGGSDEEGESVVSSPASLLGEAATAPALIALLVLGAGALVAGPALRVYGNRRARKAAEAP